MELVGTDDSPDRKAATAVIEGGQADPKACDLGKNLGAVVDEVLTITGRLIVLPRVVGDGETDVVRAHWRSDSTGRIAD